MQHLDWRGSSIFVPLKERYGIDLLAPYPKMAAVQAALQAADPAVMLPVDLRERIRVRKMTSDPSPLDGAALAVQLQAADPAADLPGPLRERIQLADGHAICIIDGLSIAATHVSSNGRIWAEMPSSRP